MTSEPVKTYLQDEKIHTQLPASGSARAREGHDVASRVSFAANPGLPVLRKFTPCGHTIIIQIVFFLAPLLQILVQGAHKFVDFRALAEARKQTQWRSSEKSGTCLLHPSRNPVNSWHSLRVSPHKRANESQDKRRSVSCSNCESPDWPPEVEQSRVAARVSSQATSCN